MDKQIVITGSSWERGGEWYKVTQRDIFIKKDIDQQRITLFVNKL